MKPLSTPILAEDLLLVLFQPDSGTIAGENALSSVLAGAVLADLAFNESITATTTRAGAVSLEAVAGRPPWDAMLRSAWDHAADHPGDVRAMLTAIGPPLRQPLLERLVARGDIREENGKVLGLFKTATLKDGGSGRRSGLIGEVRNVLVNGVEPTPRVAALAALLSGSGTLHQFDPEIPWSPVVITRAQALEHGQWSIAGATTAVAEATAAMVGIITATIRARSHEPG